MVGKLTQLNQLVNKIFLFVVESTNGSIQSIEAKLEKLKRVIDDKKIHDNGRMP